MKMILAALLAAAFVLPASEPVEAEASGLSVLSAITEASEMVGEGDFSGGRETLDRLTGIPTECAAAVGLVYLIAVMGEATESDASEAAGMGAATVIALGNMEDYASKAMLECASAG